MGVAELSRLLQLPKSTVQRSLVTLAELQWIEPAGSSFVQWSLGPEARRFAKNNGGEAALREAALIPMQSLRDDTGEAVHLVVPTGLAEVTVIERIDSNQAVRTFVELGVQAPIYAQSSGLAMLASMPASRIDAVMAAGVKQFSPTGLRSVAELEEALTHVRACGYALNLSMYRKQVCAVGAAIFDPNGNVLGGLAMSMPDSRYDESKLPAWGERVKAAAAEVSARLVG